MKILVLKIILSCIRETKFSHPENFGVRILSNLVTETFKIRNLFIISLVSYSCVFLLFYYLFNFNSQSIKILFKYLLLDFHAVKRNILHERCKIQYLKFLSSVQILLNYLNFLLVKKFKEPTHFVIADKKKTVFTNRPFLEDQAVHLNCVKFKIFILQKNSPIHLRFISNLTLILNCTEFLLIF